MQRCNIEHGRKRRWLHSPDPRFREKVNEICALYAQAPKGSVVLSIDEKTGIQAIERKHQDHAPKPGRLRRRKFEYIRRGTQALIAGMDVHIGRIIGQCRDRRTQADIVGFMEEMAQAYPKRKIHIVWDNLNTHRAQTVWDEFNARHNRRFVLHYTPLHASWVNQIELLFGIYTRRVLRHASHTSIEHLRQRTEAFIVQRNQAAKPFKWSFAGFELQTGEPLRINNDGKLRRKNKVRRAATTTDQVHWARPRQRSALRQTPAHPNAAP